MSRIALRSIADSSPCSGTDSGAGSVVSGGMRYFFSILLGLVKKCKTVMGRGFPLGQ